MSTRSMSRWASVAAVAVWGSIALARPSGTLTGVVTDAKTGRPISRATIVVTGPSRAPENTETDACGSFALDLQPGTYVVAVAAAGYGRAVRRGVAVFVERTARAPFVLSPSSDIEAHAGPGDGSASRSVYNAVLSPTVEDSVNTVRDGNPATAAFFIGPRDARSAVPGDSWTVDAEILKEKGNVPLVVTMSCPFCAPPRTQRSAITYVGEQKTSTMARFTFTPLRSELADPDGVGQVGFEVSRDGKQVDYVRVPVSVLDGSPGGVLERVPPVRTAAVAAPPGSPDVDLTITVRTNGNTIEVQLVPDAPELKARLGGKYVRDGDFRWFRSGLKANEIAELMGAFYLELGGAVNNDSTLRKQLSGSPEKAPTTLREMALGPKQRDELLQLIARTGRQLYSDLFRRTDPVLMEMMEQFHGYARDDRPVRVKVETDGLYLPWQVLLRPQTPLGEMWGFKYELWVSPTGTVSLPGPYEGPLRYREGAFLFGRYGASGDDDVAKLGRAHTLALTSNLRFKGVVSVESRDAFLGHLRDGRRPVQLVMTYTHAESGTVVSGDGTVAPHVAGPRLRFAKDEYLAARELDVMAGETMGALLIRSPLVFLNGCGTGTSGFFATTNRGFAGAFLKLGARGVIVTEAPVWAFFGYQFGLSFLGELDKGTRAPLAMLRTRKAFLDDALNPLGLLYSYYGGPDVSIQMAR